MERIITFAVYLVLAGTDPGAVHAGAATPAPAAPSAVQTNYEENLKRNRMAWNDDKSHLKITATTDEYNKWLWPITIAPTRSTSISAPFEDDIITLAMGNPGAFLVEPPSDGSKNYVFVRPAPGTPLGAKTTMTLVLQSGLRITFDVTVGRIEQAVVNVDTTVWGREKVDPWIEKKVAYEMAKITQREKMRAAEMDQEAQGRATETLLKDILGHCEIQSLQKTARNANVILRTISKARLGNWIYLRFLLKNNSDKSYAFSKAQIDVVRKPTGLSSLFTSEQPTTQPLARQTFFVENTKIPSGEERYGVLGFPIPEQWQTGDIFNVTVFEQGLQRNITIEDIDLTWD